MPEVVSLFYDTAALKVSHQPQPNTLNACILFVSLSAHRLSLFCLSAHRLSLFCLSAHRLSLFCLSAHRLCSFLRQAKRLFVPSACQAPEKFCGKAKWKSETKISKLLGFEHLPQVALSRIYVFSLHSNAINTQRLNATLIIHNNHF